MALPNVLQTGRSGLTAAKTNIAQTGHNIANSTTEGYSRQRVSTEADAPRTGFGKTLIGTGAKVGRNERMNDLYLEKQLRNASRELSHAEEKDLALRQTEDIFNEMGGDGLNRLVSRFFNEFRKLANEPDSEALRQGVREASQAMVGDFKRLRAEVQEVANHIDSRIDGYVREINDLAGQVRDLNTRIFEQEVTGASPNDLKDKRDLALKKLGSYMDLSMNMDSDGRYNVDAKGIGPLVTGNEVQKLSTRRTPADLVNGKPENSLDIRTSTTNSNITHLLKGGKIGALVEVRDQTLGTILNRLDELAHGIATAVNDVHSKGVTRDGLTGVAFFKIPPQVERSAEYLDLSDDVKQSPSNIATAVGQDSPGDNRIAQAIADIQSRKVMDDGRVSIDDYYNSIISDVGVATARNRSTLNQAKDVSNQLAKFREQLSGVSIDEETTNLMQYQQAFAASAKVIQVADELLKTVLELKR